MSTSNTTSTTKRFDAISLPFFGDLSHLFSTSVIYLSFIFEYLRDDDKSNVTKTETTFELY